MKELELDKVTRHWCPTCSAWMDLQFDLLVMNVEGVEVRLNGFPLLHCTKCAVTHLPECAKRIVAFFVQDAKQKKQAKIHVKPTGVLTKRFPFVKVGFASLLSKIIGAW